MANPSLRLPTAFLAMLVIPSMATLPYNPTRALFSPSSKSDTVYVFQPPTAALSSSQLLAINTTRSFSADSLPYTTISSSLPFLSDGKMEAFTPVMDEDGNILVYAGNCSDAVRGSEFWRFSPTNNSLDLHGAWAKMDLSSSGVETPSLDGPNYLAAAIAFASTNTTKSGMYIFGGMCPNSGSSTIDTWTQSANYSNKMLTIEMAGALSPSSTNYNLGTSSSRGPPIAEAGFSITPLEPTFSDSSDGNGIRHKSQNFVLLGGHTQEAFINMSQVALLSLPEESWSFLPVQPPTPANRTGLSTRDVTTVHPRSGHTALLTPDGKSVIVFGGWVGDVTISADPQLAILELGEGFGGRGEWQWSVPTQTGMGPELGSGLYGHGAVMLPGGVMMVVGGYTIPTIGNANAKRSDPSRSVRNYFYNTTSSSWISMYIHPNATSGESSSSVHGADTMTTDKKVGLGAGLTLGFLALIGVIIVYFWYSHRLKQRREAREEELRNLAAGGQRAHFLGQGNTDMEERSRSSRDAYSWSVSNQGPSVKGAERTGLLFEVPSPTRGLRRSVYSRGAYQTAPRYDERRRSRGSGNIHPIDERDEYGEDVVDGTSSMKPEMMQQRSGAILGSVPNLDPFRDLREVSRSPSPQSPARERALEVQNWVSDWAAADALMHHHGGRISPDKTDRTSSTLSEQSTRSTLSAHSFQRSGGTVSRSMSQRSAALFSSKPLSKTTITAATSSFIATQGGSRDHSPNQRRSQSLTLLSNPRRTTTSDTFMTAPTSFRQLQVESEALLGGYSSGGETSPTKPNSRARGWMGSVRRAFAGADRSTSTSPENGYRSNSSSPTNHQHTDTGLPKRAASASAMLWQRKQGAKDWDVEGGGNVDLGTNTKLRGAEDEEWDVESAVERRVVQVMFTVPREKLRVVNAGPDGDGESILSVKEKDINDGNGNGKGKGKEKG